MSRLDLVLSRSDLNSKQISIPAAPIEVQQFHFTQLNGDMIGAAVVTAQQRPTLFPSSDHSALAVHPRLPLTHVGYDTSSKAVYSATSHAESLRLLEGASSLQSSCSSRRENSHAVVARCDLLTLEMHPGLLRLRFFLKIETIIMPPVGNAAWFVGVLSHLPPCYKAI